MFKISTLEASCLMLMLSACIPSDERVFNNLLCSLSDERSFEESIKNMDELGDFFIRYPQSRFADDAEFIFTDMKSSSLNSNLAIPIWEDFLKKHKYASVEVETVEKLGAFYDGVNYPYRIQLLHAQLAEAMLAGNKELVQSIIREMISMLDAHNERHRSLIETYSNVSKHEKWRK